MQTARVRRLINEEVKKQIANDAFGEEFEYIVAEMPLNEGILGDIVSSDAVKGIANFALDNLPKASIDSFKLWIINNLFRYLEEQGFPIDRTSLFGIILSNVIKNLASSEALDYFKEGGCEIIVDKIIMGLQDGLITDTVLDQIARVFFGEGARMAGIIGSPLRELILIKLKQMTEKLREPLVDFACNHRDIGKLKSAMMSAANSPSASSDSEEESEEDKGSSRSLVRLG